MGKSDRCGDRKKRILQHRLRTPELGYYFIVTDTKDTEQKYLYGLRDSIDSKFKDKIVIKVLTRTRINDLVEQCLQKLAFEPQYRIPWIIFDRDEVTNFDEVIEKAHRNNIQVGWSNPCIEIWFNAYFGEMPTCSNSVECNSTFSRIFKQKTGKKYVKSDPDIYINLCKYGNEEKAIKLAESKLKQSCCEKEGISSQICPGTTLHLLIKEIKNKIE